MTEIILDIKKLSKKFPVSDGLWGTQKSYINAIDNLSLAVSKGEILAIAGESGCGKTTLGRCIAKLEHPSSGEIFFSGMDVRNLRKNDLRNFRKKVQMIFQNPYASLNPKMLVGEILKESLVINKFPKKEIKKRIEETISMVGMNTADLKKYPHEFSGGQRQRIAIARSLVLHPEFVVADEPVSALDVSIQAQIINLLLQLKNELNLTIIFISHDLSVIRHIADKIAVMYLGEIVEQGTTDEIFENPLHPYTRLLLESIPVINGKKQHLCSCSDRNICTKNFNKTCKFSDRCTMQSEQCKPSQIFVSETHFVKCSENL